MKKVAVCFYGKFSDTNDRGEIGGFERAFLYNKNNIFSDNTDVFLHGWSVNEKKDSSLIELFNPKKYIIEKQKKFDHPYKHYNFIPSGAWNTQLSINNLYSKSFSIKKALELVPREEYDLILLTRYDNIFYEKINFDIFKSELFYTTNWHVNSEGWGFNDVWFISGIDIAQQMSKIYDRLDDYLNLESEYFKFLCSKGLEHKNIGSHHPIWRYRLKELDLDDKIYMYGLEYETWSLIRKEGIRNNPWGMPDFDIRKPKKYTY